MRCWETAGFRRPAATYSNGLKAEAAVGYNPGMPRLLHDQRVFWRQFRQNFHSTGAVLPSGRFLARSLARYVGTTDQPQKVLEVGPGTGAVTDQIIRRLGPHDELDLVELNDQFVAHLQRRFNDEPAFQQVSPRCRVLHKRVEELSDSGHYDLIVSGLPLNNFSVEDVEQILAGFARLVRPGGMLSFFEYIAIRPARAMVSGRRERARLQGISRALGGLLGAHEERRDWIWPNIPPAWVHHVRFPIASVGGQS